MSTRKFEYGDRVRHTSRPEWGVGSIIQAEHLSVNGQEAQRVSERGTQDHQYGARGTGDRQR